MTDTFSGATTRQPTDPEERLAYLALALAPGIGGRRLAALLSAYGSAIAALHAATRRASHLDPHIATTLRLLRGASIDEARTQEIRCGVTGITLLAPFDDAFPATLRSIPDPPVLLFARGNLALLDTPAVAIIGSRNHTAYGQEVAASVSGAVAAAGIVVVSGMARGLDAVAHAAALESGGTTIGVLGNGLGVIYPAANAALYRQVEQSGLLLTEHPPGERPQTFFFPRRNRIISGLAQVIIVVEAAAGSGTLVTVTCALEQGREVMAVPGPINSPTSVGTNRLIRDGAEPLLDVVDLLAKFSVTSVVASVQPAGMLAPVCTLSGDEAQVFNALTAEPRLVDDVAEATGLPIGRLLGLLCGLELGGLVEQSPGSLFRRVARN